MEKQVRENVCFLECISSDAPDREKRGDQDTFIIADPGFFLLTALTVRATSTNGFFSGFPSWQISTIVVSSIRKNLQIPYRVYVQSSLVTGPDEGKDRSRMTGSQNSRSISSRVPPARRAFLTWTKTRFPFPAIMKSQRFSLFFTKLITVPLAVATRRASSNPCRGGRPLVTYHLRSHYLDPDHHGGYPGCLRVAGLFLFCILSSFCSNFMVVSNQRFPGY
jgi:hypothetical protein